MKWHGYAVSCTFLIPIAIFPHLFGKFLFQGSTFCLESSCLNCISFKEVEEQRQGLERFLNQYCSFFAVMLTLQKRV